MRNLKNIMRRHISLLGFLGVLSLWQVAGLLKLLPRFILPTPLEILQSFVRDREFLWYHSWATLRVALLGLVLGVLIACIMAVLMDSLGWLNDLIYPMMVVVQTIPTIAIAPILVLWMGFGMAPKITLVVITTFFPITIGLLDGYKSVDPDAIRLMKAMGASRAQIFRHVKFPGALPQFFSGLKISASYAVVGAVVSEWLGGFNGLGVYMTRVKKAYSFDKMFAVIIFIVIISLLLLLAVNIVSRITMPWLQVEKE